MKKRTIKQLALYGQLKGVHRDREYTGVACDSRLVKSGQLFVALKGVKVDGHLFLKEAAEKGAVAAIVEQNYTGPHFEMALLHVNDVLITLQQLAKDELAALQAKTIAVTGSVGKTTVKEFIYTLFKETYPTLATSGNANSQIGMPVALLNGIQGNEEIVVCEMGMSQAGEISQLIRIAPPHLAVITCVDFVHAANFNCINDIIRAKCEILTHPATEYALINHDILNQENLVLRPSLKVKTFSHQDPKADFFFEKTFQGELLIKWNHEVVAQFPPLDLPGTHNAYNFLIAATAAHLMGLSWSEVAARQKLMQLPEKRLQFIEKRGVLFVNDSYNSSLIAVKAALEALPIPHQSGRRFAALGEMLDLGKLTESHHREVGEYALPILDQVYCLGEACKPIQEVWKSAQKPCYLFLDQKELITALRQELKPGDIVLVKGSSLKEMWKVIDEMD